MEETKRIGLFRALFNVGGAMVNIDESTNEIITWDGLRKSDFDNAGINKKEQEELSSSLERIKLVVLKFFENVKSKVKKTVSHLKESNKERKTTDEKRIKIEDNDQRDQEKEMID